MSSCSSRMRSRIARFRSRTLGFLRRGPANCDLRWTVSFLFDGMCEVEDRRTTVQKSEPVSSDAEEGNIL